MTILGVTLLSLAALLVVLAWLRPSNTTIQARKQYCQLATAKPKGSVHYSGSSNIERIVSIVISSVMGCKGDSTKPREK